MNRNWAICEHREKLIKIPKKETVLTESNVNNRIEKHLYDYYLCDVCLREVRVDNFSKEYKRNGAIVRYRTPNGRKFDFVVHTSCFKEALQQLDDYYNRGD